MIKKRIAIFFLIFSNLILLVHAIMPHCHHDGEICIFNTDCDSNENNNKHSDSEHERNEKTDDECCILGQAVVIPPNTDRLTCKCTGFKYENSHYFYIPLHYHKHGLFATNLERNPIPPLIFSYSQIVKNLLGLRAPPFV